MTIEALKQYLAAIRMRYKNATRKQQGLIRDEFCQHSVPLRQDPGSVTFGKCLKLLLTILLPRRSLRTKYDQLISIT